MNIKISSITPYASSYNMDLKVFNSVISISLIFTIPQIGGIY